MKINIIPVSMLINTHLVYEHQSIEKLVKQVSQHDHDKVMPKSLNIPVQYCLGTGGFKFFYNKMKFVFTRYQETFAELGERGYEPNFENFSACLGTRAFLSEEWMGDFHPSPEDYYLNFVSLIKNCNINTVDKALKEVSDAYLYAVAKGKRNV